MKLRKKTHTLAAAALGALAALPATAAFADTASDIRALKAQLKQLEAKVAKQHNEAASHATNVANHATPKGEHGHAAPPPVFVSFKNGLYVETEDKDFSFGINGRVHIDGGVQSEPEAGSASNVFLRRARMDVVGKAFKHWYYRLQFEIAGGGGGLVNQGGASQIRDAWMGFKYPLLAALGLKKDIFIQIGNHLEPFGLETLNTSNSGTTFVERSMMGDAFHPFRHIGASVSAGDYNWGVKGGIYTQSPQDASPRPPVGGSQYWELTGRAVVLPVRTDDTLLHFGVSGRYYRPGDSTAANDDRRLQPGRNIRNEANVLNTNMLGTPDLSCNPQTLSTAGTILALSAANITGRNCVKRSLSFNLEGLAVYGPFSLQGEYTFNHYDRDPTIMAQNLLFSQAPVTAARLFAGAPGGTSVNTSGYYAQAALFLTGETRVSGYTDLEHNVNTPNSFSNQPKILHPISKGGIGAWEVAARYSAINLNNGGLTGLNYLGALGALNLVPTTSTPANLRQLVALSNTGTIGGRQANMTLGLNWYPEKGFRFLMNYIRVMNNVAPFDRPFLNGNHTSIFLTRAEVFW